MVCYIFTNYIFLQVDAIQIQGEMDVQPGAVPDKMYVAGGGHEYQRMWTMDNFKGNLAGQ